MTGAGTGTGTETPDPRKSRAVLIHSGEFTDRAYGELSATRRTAEGLRKRFLDSAVWGLGVAGCSVLGPGHHREQILQTVKDMSQQAEECFVLYFGGHGVDHDKRLLLPLPHSTAGLPGSMLSFAHLMEAMDEGRAQRKIVVLDCCNAARGLNDLPFEQHVARESPEGCYVLAACAANRQAKSPGDDEFTAFGGVLISSLDAGGGPEEPFWTPAGLLTAMEERLTREGNPRPMTNGSPVGESPWLKNRGHLETYTPSGHHGPGARPSAAAGRTGSAGKEAAAVHLGPDPGALPQYFVGRDAMLADIRRRVRVGQILPVVGSREVGKSALIAWLVADAGSLPGLPRPPRVLEITPVEGAEKPMLNALTVAFQQSLDESERPAASEQRSEELLDWILPRYVKGGSLLLLVKASKVDLSRPELRRGLDELLAHGVFEQAAVVVEGTVSVDVDGHGRLAPRTSLEVDPLNTRDALRLIEAMLGDEGLSTDLEALAALVEEEKILRRPGTITRAVQYACRRHQKDSWDSFLTAGASAGAEDVVERDVLLEALIEAAAMTVEWALERAWPVAPAESGAGRGRLLADGHAVLLVWGLLDRLPLTVGTLRGLGLSDDVLRLLFTEGLIVPGRSTPEPPVRQGRVAGNDRYVELSMVAREGLRSDLRDKAGQGQDADSRPATEGAGDSDDLDGRLADAAKRLVTAVLPTGRTADGTDPAPHADADPDRPLPVIEQLRLAAGWLAHNLPGALPRLRERFGSYVNGSHADAELLPVAQSVADLPPVPAPDAAEPLVRDEREAVGELQAAAGRLNVASRAPAPDGRATDVFVRSFEYAVSLLEAVGDAAPAAMLRSVDQSGRRGTRRVRDPERTVPARLRLLRGLAPSDPGSLAAVRADRLVASVSWALNTSSAQLAADDREGARASLRTAERLMEALPPAQAPRTLQTRKWLRYRVSQLRHRLAETSAGRHEATRDAYGLARENLLAADGLPGRQEEWTKSLLTSGHQYARETREDEERLTLAAQTLDALGSAWGPRAEWPAPLLGRTAAFLRQVHCRHADLDRQYEGAKEVVSFLHDLTGPGSGPGPRAEPMVELARAYEFLASVQRDRNEYALAAQSLRHALSVAHKVAQAEPGVRTYMTWLRLLRTKQIWSGGRGYGLLPELADAVRQIRDWLGDPDTAGDHGQAQNQGGDRDHGQGAGLLHLWCLDCEWMKTGGLVNAAKERARRVQLPMRLSMPQVVRQRQNSLDRHEERFGRSWPSYETRVRMIREYERWKAIDDGRPLDVAHAPVWKLLDDARKRFPHDLDVVRERAGYHRYIWEYDRAAELHLEAARQELNGDKARRDIVAAAECLLSQALFQPDLTEEQRTSALRAAAGQLREVRGLHLQSHHVALLSARISLELQESDGTEADAKFVELIDENFVSTVARFLNERAHRVPGAAADEEPAPQDGGEDGPGAVAEKSMALQDLLEEHFTEREVLAPLGLLYLRRAELAADGDPEGALTSAWRAYNCFDGCRVMEEAVSGREKVTTAFLRARTIAWAVELSSSADPFAADSGRHRSLGSLAESLLQSARDRSVGRFHELIKEWEKRLRALMAKTGGP